MAVPPQYAHLTCEQFLSIEETNQSKSNNNEVEKSQDATAKCLYEYNKNFRAKADKIMASMGVDRKKANGPSRALRHNANKIFIKNPNKNPQEGSDVRNE